jgi:hypothetical protein
MVWWWRGTRRFALSLLLAVPMALAGCQAQQTAPLAGRPVVGVSSSQGSDAAALLRAQKPESTDAAIRQSMLELGPADPGSRDTRASRIRAVVNGEAILDEEVMAAAFQGMVAAQNEKEKEEVFKAKLNEIIDREVILQDAQARLKNGGERFLKELKKAANREFDKEWLHKLMRANHFTDAEKFKVFLRQGGMPLDLIRRQWERNFIAMQYLRTRIDPQMNKVGHLQIHDYYLRHADEFHVEDSVTWQDVFITAGAPHPSREAASQFADTLVARIRKGEDFARLAKEYDNGDSHFRENCEGVGHKRGEIRPQHLEEGLFKMKPGEVARVEMEHGFHIVKLLGRQRAGKRPFDEKVQKEIKEKLRAEVFQLEMKRIVNDLKRHSIIEIANEVK